MKRLFCVLFTLLFVFNLSSCKKTPSAQTILAEFFAAYDARRTVYSSDKGLYEEGYISPELLRRLYVFDGELDCEFAIAPNERTESGFEAGVFIADSSGEIGTITEMCRERLNLLLGGYSEGIILRRGRVIFYTSASDSLKAEKLFAKIIGAYY